jgi:hypothetical protein
VGAEPACLAALKAAVGQLAPERLALAWAVSDQVPILLGQFNFFQAFDVCFFPCTRYFQQQFVPAAASLPVAEVLLIAHQDAQAVYRDLCGLTMYPFGSPPSFRRWRRSP